MDPNSANPPKSTNQPEGNTAKPGKAANANRIKNNEKKRNRDASTAPDGESSKRQKSLSPSNEPNDASTDANNDTNNDANEELNPHRVETNMDEYEDGEEMEIEDLLGELVPTNAVQTQTDGSAIETLVTRVIDTAVTRLTTLILDESQKIQRTVTNETTNVLNEISDTNQTINGIEQDLSTVRNELGQVAETTGRTGGTVARLVDFFESQVSDNDCERFNNVKRTTNSERKSNYSPRGGEDASRMRPRRLFPTPNKRSDANIHSSNGQSPKRTFADAAKAAAMYQSPPKRVRYDQEQFQGVNVNRSNNRHGQRENEIRQPTGHSDRNEPPRRAGPPPPSCLFCGGAHFSDSCEVVGTLGARLDIVEAKNACPKCLHLHLPYPCRPAPNGKPRVCEHCKIEGDHHSAICGSPAHKRILAERRARKERRDAEEERRRRDEDDRQ